MYTFKFTLWLYIYGTLQTDNKRYLRDKHEVILISLPSRCPFCTRAVTWKDCLAFQTDALIIQPSCSQIQDGSEIIEKLREMGFHGNTVSFSFSPAWRHVRLPGKPPAQRCVCTDESSRASEYKKMGARIHIHRDVVRAAWIIYWLSGWSVVAGFILLCVSHLSNLSCFMCNKTITFTSLIRAGIHSS